MKMLKSLLLGVAAGMIAFASAQAADLPVKARPAQYLHISNHYSNASINSNMLGVGACAIVLPANVAINQPVEPIIGDGGTLLGPNVASSETTVNKENGGIEGSGLIIEGAGFG